MKNKIGTQVLTRPLTPDQKIVKPGEMAARIQLVVLRADGTIRQQIDKISESYVQQFLQLLWVQMTGALYYQYISDTTGVAQVIGLDSGSNIIFATNAPAGNVLFGTVVGTGNTPPGITDYALQTLIAHGVGAGQLQYGGVTYGAPSSDATTSQFTITRNFANASGDAITINEIGLYVKAKANTNRTSSTRYLMTIRDVIGGGIAVPNGETLTVNYRPLCVV
jgi:hypothetical protein